MLTAYFEAAMKRAEIEWLDGDEIFTGTIPGFQGVIGTGESEAECLEDLRHALEGWVALGLSLGHELPTVSGLNPRLRVPA